MAGRSDGRTGTDRLIDQRQAATSSIHLTRTHVITDTQTVAQSLSLSLSLSITVYISPTLKCVIAMSGLAKSDITSFHYIISTPLYFRTLWRYRNRIIIIIIIIIT